MTPEAKRARVFQEPPALTSGARVALVAPSGPLRDASEVEYAMSSARSLGWEPVVGPNALHRLGYFAGSDEERAADFNAAVADPDIQGIWCLRGGYGAMRLLGALNLSPLAAHPKALIGYSDITALHSAWQRVGLISYHGPTARSELTEFSRESLLRAVSLRGDSAGSAPEAKILREGRVSGKLIGGNLALVSALCGTAWQLDFREAIVVLEDTNEATYRVDRMLTQLRLAGAFDGCRGFVFGHCTNCPETSDDGERTLADVVQETADGLQVPALLGVPLGHIADQWTLPLGAQAILDSRTRTIQIQRDLRS